jgi:hypothetical protein
MPERKVNKWPLTAFNICNADASEFVVCVSGRELWALTCLLRAGEAGCTPVDNPAPRWSAYVHDLRGMGIEIETISEPNGGDFAGHHARYVLRSRVVPVLAVAA